MDKHQDLISKCVSFDPNERPTFIQTTEILQSLFIDSFIKYKKTQESEQQFISILQKYSIPNDRTGFGLICLKEPNI